MSENLPDKSKGSIEERLWLVFDDGINVIRFWGSTFSAKEKLYLNDNLIINKNNFKFKEELQFQDDNGNIYQFRLFINSFLKGEIESTLTRNDEFIKRIIIRGDKIGGDSRTNFSKTLLYFAVVVSIFTLESMFNLSFIVELGLLVLAFVIYIKSLDKGRIEYLFEELGH